MKNIRNESPMPFAMVLKLILTCKKATKNVFSLTKPMRIYDIRKSELENLLPFHDLVYHKYYGIWLSLHQFPITKKLKNIITFHSCLHNLK